VALGEARVASAIGDVGRLQIALRTLDSNVAGAAAADRVAVMRVRALTYATRLAYAALDFDGASVFAERAAKTLARVRDVPPHVKAEFLTSRTVVDFHNYNRARCIDEDSAEAYSLGIEHGMEEAAASALFNALMFRLYSGGMCEPASFATGRNDETLRGAVVFGDPLLAAAAAAALGDYATAIDKLQLTNSIRLEGLIDGDMPVTDFHAQLLLLAGNYPDALRAARASLRHWKSIGLPCEGVALCIEAHALEALGRPDEARRSIDKSIAALEPLSTIPNLVAAYRCAHRLTGERRFERSAAALIDSLQQRDPGAKGPRLTAREREVAQLVLAGRSNLDIGNELGISHRTVATHVESVLRRLDLRARWQITAEHLSA
jgi:DNA-binding CsgD family transcriptional regulator